MIRRNIGIILSIILLFSIFSCTIPAYAQSTIVPAHSSSVIVSDGYIYGLNTEGTTLAYIKEQVNNEAITALKNDAVLSDADYIGTGTLISAGETTLTAILYGDVNGDGAIDAFDAFAIDKDMNGLTDLIGVYAMAGDIQQDGNVDVEDYSAIINHLSGIALIDQSGLDLPEAEIEEIASVTIGGFTSDAAVRLRALQNEEEIQNKAYKDWDVDILISFDKNIDASTTYLAGQYGEFGWIGGQLGTGEIAANQEISVIHDWLPAVLGRESVSINYTELVRDVVTFDCAVCSACDFGTTATIKIVMTDADNNKYVVDTYSRTWLPQADVTEIEPVTIGSFTSDTAIELAATQTSEEITGRGYDKWDVDFVLSFDSAVNKENVYLAGQYGEFEWIGGQLGTDTLNAGEKIRVIHDWLPVILERESVSVNYEELVETIRTFRCAVCAFGADGITATVDIVMTNAVTGEQLTIDSYNYTF